MLSESTNNGAEIVSSRRLLRKLCVACGLAAIALSSTPASAYIIGSVQDWRDWVNGTGPFDPYNAQTLVDEIFWSSHDHLSMLVTPTTGVFGGGVAFGDTAPYGGIIDGYFRITTIYGIDMDPNSVTMSLTGFNPLAPEIIPVSGETIVTNFGTEYTSFAEYTVTAASLGALLPGYNLSPFAAADPSSIFYVFQTDAPIDEILTPEPASTMLLLSGGLICCVANRRARSI